MPQTRNQHSWCCSTSARTGDRLVTSQGPSALSQWGELEENHPVTAAGNSWAQPGKAQINMPPLGSGGLLLQGSSGCQQSAGDRHRTAQCDLGVPCVCGAGQLLQNPPGFKGWRSCHSSWSSSSAWFQLFLWYYLFLILLWPCRNTTPMPAFHFPLSTHSGI